MCVFTSNQHNKHCTAAVSLLSQPARFQFVCLEEKPLVLPRVKKKQWFARILLVTCRTFHSWLFLRRCCLKIPPKGGLVPGLHSAVCWTPVKYFSSKILVFYLFIYFSEIWAKFHWENIRETDKKKDGLRGKTQKQYSVLKKIKISSLHNHSFTCHVDSMQGSSFNLLKN